MGGADALIEHIHREKGGDPWLMAVLNVTPDSFSDGGRFLAPTSWRAQIDRVIAEGARVIDVGGESTRPGAHAVPAAEQIHRVIEPITYAAARGALVSIDTTLPEVAEAAIAAGARVVNDVSCLSDPDLATVAKRAGCALVIMHSRGAMAKMEGFSRYPKDGYADVVADVARELAEAVDRAGRAGMPRERVLVDPGLGFHKAAAHSYALLRRVGELRSIAPLVVGASRKSFLARDVAAPPDERVGASIAAAIHAAAQGAAMLRVHDVLATRQALAVTRAITEAAVA